MAVVLGQTVTVGLRNSADSTNDASAGDVIALVNGIPITSAELDKTILAPLARLEQQALQVRQLALDSLIDKRLIEQEAKRRGIDGSALEELEVTARGLDVRSRDARSDIARPQRDAQRGSVTFLGTPTPQRELLRASWIEDLRQRSTISTRLTPKSLVRAHVAPGASPALGAERPKVTIIEYSDFQCGFCRAMRLPLRELVSKHTDVRLVYRHLPLGGPHSSARRAAEASYCAQAQGRFWEYHDELFQHQLAFTDRMLVEFARKIGLEEHKFTTCLAGDEARRIVQNEKDEAATLGIDGTPTFLINGRPVVGQIRPELLERIISEEREAAGHSGQP